MLKKDTKISNINRDYKYFRPNSTWYLGEFGDQLLNFIDDPIFITNKKQFFGCVFSLVPKNIYLERFPKYTWPNITTDMVERIQYQTMVQKNFINGFNIYTGKFKYIDPINVSWSNLREDYESSSNLKHLFINWDRYNVNKNYKDLVDKNLIKKQTILETVDFHYELIKINTETE